MIRHILKRIKAHFKKGGLLYVGLRVVKYLKFLIISLIIKIKRDKKKSVTLKETVLSSDNLKIVVLNSGINFLWKDVLFTVHPGVNLGFNILGLWNDSARADWHIVEKATNYLKIKVYFWELPLNQTWEIKLLSKNRVKIDIWLEVEEWLHIDEIRLLCLAEGKYKCWINNFEINNFQKFGNAWRDICMSSEVSSLVGLRFPKINDIPSFTMETDEKDTFAIIQNSPQNMSAHAVGFRKIIPTGKRDYAPGTYGLFSVYFNFFSSDQPLDNKIELLRKIDLKKMSAVNNRASSTYNQGILLVNLPWQEEGQFGVRAGSRWPHIKDYYEGDYTPFPFFLAYSVALLRKHGFKSMIIDALAERLNENIFLEKVSRLGADILVAEVSTPSFKNDISLLKKMSGKGMKIVVCGPHIEIHERDFLSKHPFIDYVLFGEYEFSLLDLVTAIFENKPLCDVKGLIYREGDTIIKNPPREAFDINLLPWPSREDLPMEKYWDLPGNIPYPSVQMAASRGCPFGCNFCLWPQVMYLGNHYRVRDVKDTIDEMEYLVREMGFKSVYFDDDTFNIGKTRMLDFCNEIKKRGLNDIPWAIMARADLMDEEILNNMESAGLWAVKYGVESPNSKLIKTINKDMGIDKTTRNIKITQGLGIKTHLTFCFGADGETKDTVQETINYALKLNPESVQFSILTPFPGTKLYEKLDKEGRILTKDWFKYDGHYQCVFRHDNFTPEELVAIKKRAYGIWLDHTRRRRGVKGDIDRFNKYLRKHGLAKAISKTLSYFEFVMFKRKEFLNG